MGTFRKRGNSWIAEVCVDRQRQSKSFPTKRDAVAWANSIEQDGILARHTVQEALDKYIPIAESHKGAQAELSRLKSLSVLGSHSLERLTPAVLSTWRDDRLKQVAPVSVRREMIVLSSVLRLCRDEWGWMRDDPLKKVRRPATSKPRQRGITQAEIDAITQNLLKMRTGRQIVQIFLLSLETAMRLSEMLSLEWGDVSAKTVELKDSKNGDTRQVPLSSAARSILSERKDIDPERVFTLSAHVVSKAFQRASINGVHFHDSRSEAITRLSKKLDILQLAKMVGHRDTRSLMIYYAESAESIADRL